jgi:hypothetical protein
MKWVKQHRLSDELNGRYPRMRANVGQQMFRSAYYNLRMAGQSVTDAATTAAEIVRLYVPDFVPIQT